MEKKSVGLTILFWSEIIISLRVLLFSLPVMINKYSAGTLSLSNIGDQFIIILSLTAVLYFVAGILAVTGNVFWKAAHILAVVLVLGGTLASAKISGQALGAENKYFVLPLLFSVMLTVLTSIMGRAKKAA